MTTRKRRYSKQELAMRGNDIYKYHVRQQVEAKNQGKIVAIDIESEAFAIGNNIVEATDSLFSQYPDAQPWVIRIGHTAVYRFSGRSQQTSL